MTLNNKVYRWSAWTGIALLGIIGMASGIAYKMTLSKSTPEVRADDNPEPLPATLSVKVIHPKKGTLSRLSTLPCSVEMFESVNLYAKVAGFLNKQNVDIGKKVSKDDILAVVDVPELEKQKLHNLAAVQLARAHVSQMKARVSTAVADLDAALAAVDQAEHTSKSALALEDYRHQQLTRFKELAFNKSIEDRLVDEATKYHLAAYESKWASIAAIKTTNAQVVASRAKIIQAKADVSAAQAEVKVAQADLEKTNVLINYATIKAPFDGVVTHRNYYPRDYIRAAGDSGNNLPLFTVDQIDKMRVVVQLPERDIPFIDEKDKAEVELDAFPDEKLSGKISLIGKTLDPQTRLMRVEIHLRNPTGKIYQNVYGQATIILDEQKELVSIPAACLVSQSGNSKGKGLLSNLRWDVPTSQAHKTMDNKGIVYVVHDGHLHRVPVRLGACDGLRVVVLSDVLTADDQVVLHPGDQLQEGAEVTATLWNEAAETTSENR